MRGKMANGVSGVVSVVVSVVVGGVERRGGKERAKSARHITSLNSHLEEGLYIHRCGWRLSPGQQCWAGVRQVPGDASQVVPR